jgi:hypothetical protein
MEKLDELVTTHLSERLFQPERLAVILSSLSARQAEKADAVNARIAALQRDLSESTIGLSAFTSSSKMGSPRSTMSLRTA